MRKSIFLLSLIGLVFLLSSTLLTTPVLANQPNRALEGCDDGAINTAIGCIPVSGTAGQSPFFRFTEFFLEFAAKIGGVISLIMIAFAGFQMITAGGNPEKVQASKSLMTAAIAGLLFILFAAFILRIIGVDILGISSLSAS